MKGQHIDTLSLLGYLRELERQSYVGFSADVTFCLLRRLWEGMRLFSATFPQETTRLRKKGKPLTAKVLMVPQSIQTVPRALVRVCMCAVLLKSQRGSPTWPIPSAFLRSLEPSGVMTAKVRVTMKANLHVHFFLPVLFPGKEAICLLFPDLSFFNPFVLTVTCHSG